MGFSSLILGRRAVTRVLKRVTYIFIGWPFAVPTFEISLVYWEACTDQIELYPNNQWRLLSTCLSKWTFLPQTWTILTSWRHFPMLLLCCVETSSLPPFLTPPPKKMKLMITYSNFDSLRKESNCQPMWRNVKLCLQCTICLHVQNNKLSGHLPGVRFFMLHSPIPCMSTHRRHFLFCGSPSLWIFLNLN